MTGTLERLGALSVSLPSIVAAFVYALVNWAADVLCLAAAIAAIGVPVPWEKLVLVWSAGQAATSFNPHSLRHRHRLGYCAACGQAPVR